MEPIDIEQIMQKIREDIKGNRYIDDTLSFADVHCAKKMQYEYDEIEYEQILEKLDRQAEVPWYRNLGAGRIKGVVKKVIRKSTAFLIKPISDEQNLFNSEIVNQFKQLAGYIEQQQQLEKDLRKQISTLEEEVKLLQVNSDKENRK